ncbi:MAG: hypothetical protein NTY72_14775 [Bacteroidetes bacterium]|nr:hypothetical protein [Bacteroidota bacterium]
MRIVGIGRFNKYISKLLGSINKQKFEKYISSSNLKLPINNSNEFVDISLVTFVNSNNFSDLLLCIISFLNSVGEPKLWTLYLDDDLTERQIDLINQFDFIEKHKWNQFLDQDIAIRYSQKWQLRKFAAFSSHVILDTTIFTDSDVIYYPNFYNFLQAFETKNWYLPEPPECYNYDTSVVGEYSFNKLMYSVNAGFFILNSALSWNIGFDYLNHTIIQKSHSYFLDQTALNLIFSKDSEAMILDPRIFHASADDHFALLPLNIQGFAIRHYVGLVRHKMWQLGWRKYFK